MTTPYYADDQVTLYLGDCLAVLRSDDYGYDWNLGYREPRLFADNSVDAVVCDPPYGLEFMGKDWDAPWKTGNGFRRAENPSDAGRDNVFGRQSKRGPEYFAGSEFQQWCTAWATECLRVLKPGGHLVAFGGSRTWHRLATAIEDAGFEMRDSIAWLTGSGFPKSLDVSKDQRFCQCHRAQSTNGPAPRVDSMEQVGTADLSGLFDGVPSLTDETSRRSRADMLATVPGNPGSRPAGSDCSQGARGLDASQRGEVLGGDERCSESSLAGRCDAQAAEGELQGRSVCAVPGGVSGDGSQGRVRDGAPSGDGAVDRSAVAADRGGEPHRSQPGEQCSGESGAVSDQRGPQARRSWSVCGRCGKQSVVGLGTALKPAFEPIVVARKPLSGTVAGNVLEHGTGALNIDACRVESEAARPLVVSNRTNGNQVYGDGLQGSKAVAGGTDQGRWPTNVVLGEDQAAELDQQSGVLKSGANPTRRGGDKFRNAYGDFAGQTECVAHRGADEGGASRFFPVFRYEAKAPGSERPSVDGTAHPTVKPLELMRWLVRLVTPPHGVVLEPFAGSGTTAEACVHEHMRCIAIEREADYLPLITARLTKPMEVGFDFGSAS